jgi:hypothetical protein
MQLQAEAAAAKLTNDAAANAEKLKDKYIQDYRSGKATDAQAKKLDEAYGKALTEAGNEVRLAGSNADLEGGDAKKAMADKVKEIQQRSKDPIFEDNFEEVAKEVTKEGQTTRATRIAGYKLANAAEKLEASPNDATARKEFEDAKLVFNGALEKEFKVTAAEVELDSAKGGLEGVKKIPNGALRSEAAGLVATARAQLEKAQAGTDIDLSPTSYDKATEILKQRYGGGVAERELELDALGLRLKLKDEMQGIDPNSPLLSPQEKKLAETDPAALALARMNGIRIDAADPTLNGTERELARSHPYQFVLYKLSGKVVDTLKIADPAQRLLAEQDPLGYAVGQLDKKDMTRLSMIDMATFGVRIEAADKRITDLMAKGDYKTALKLSHSAWSGALTPEQREATKAALYDKHFTKDFWKKQLDWHKTHRDGVPGDNVGVRNTTHGNNAGMWMTDLLKETKSPLAANDLLTLVLEEKGLWTESEGQSYDLREFYVGVSVANETALGGGFDRTNELVNLMMKEGSSANQVVLAFKMDGYSSMQAAAGHGGTTLSTALIDRLKQSGRFDVTDKYQIQDALKRGGNAFQRNEIAPAQYKAFQQAPDLFAQDAFDKYLHPVGGSTPGLLEGPQRLGGTQRRQAIGAMLWQAPNTGKTGANDEWYSGDIREKLIDPVDKKIVELGGENAEVRYVPLLYVSPSDGQQNTALFVVTTKDGGKRLVDDRGWDYDYDESKPLKDRLKDYIENNGLSDKGRIYLPQDLKISEKNGHVDITSMEAHHTTTGEKVKNTVGIVVGIAAAAAGLVLMVGSGGLATPISVGLWATVGIGSGYGAFTAGSALYNIYEHGGDLTSGDAIMNWVMLVSSVAGGGSAGAQLRALRLGTNTDRLANAAIAAENAGDMGNMSKLSDAVGQSLVRQQVWLGRSQYLGKFGGVTGGVVLAQQTATLVSQLGQGDGGNPMDWAMTTLGLAQVIIGRASQGRVNGGGGNPALNQFRPPSTLAPHGGAGPDVPLAPVRVNGPDVGLVSETAVTAAAVMPKGTGLPGDPAAPPSSKTGTAPNTRHKEPDASQPEPANAPENPRARRSPLHWARDIMTTQPKNTSIMPETMITATGAVRLAAAGMREHGLPVVFGVLSNKWTNYAAFPLSGLGRGWYLTASQRSKESVAAATQGDDVKSTKLLEKIFKGSGWRGDKRIEQGAQDDLRGYLNDVSARGKAFRDTLAEWKALYPQAPAGRQFNLFRMRPTADTEVLLAPAGWLKGNPGMSRYFKQVSEDATSPLHGKSEAEVRTELLTRLNKMDAPALQRAADPKGTDHSPEAVLLRQFPELHAKFVDTVEVRTRLRDTHGKLYEKLKERLYDEKTGKLDPKMAEGWAGSTNSPNTRLGLFGRRAVLVANFSVFSGLATKAPYAGDALAIQAGNYADGLSIGTLGAAYVYSKKVDALAATEKRKAAIEERVDGLVKQSGLTRKEFLEQNESLALELDGVALDVKNAKAAKDTWNKIRDWVGIASAGRAVAVGFGLLALEAPPMLAYASFTQGALTGGWVALQLIPSLRNGLAPKTTKFLKWSAVGMIIATPAAINAYLTWNPLNKERKDSPAARLWQPVVDGSTDRLRQPSREIVPNTLDPASNDPFVQGWPKPLQDGGLRPPWPLFNAPVPRHETWAVDPTNPARANFSGMAIAKAQREGSSYNEALDQLFQLNGQYSRSLLDGVAEPGRRDDPDAPLAGALINVGASSLFTRLG